MPNCGGPAGAARHAEAVEILEKAIQFYAHWAELHFNLGYACAHLAGRGGRGALP